MRYDIEIWADPECTIRPVTGSAYTDLYFQAGHKLEWTNEALQIGLMPDMLEFCAEGGGGQPYMYSLKLFRDWKSQYFDIPVIDAGSVIRCHTASPETLRARLFSYDMP